MQQWRGNELLPLRDPQSAICSFPDCRRPHHGRGLCRNHWRQKNKGATPSPLRADVPKRICSFPDCGRPHHSRDLCWSHYRLWSNGESLRPIRRVDLSNEERFNSYVDRSGPCHIWTGTGTGTGAKGAGYGQFHMNGQTLNAHRVAWKFEHGEIPPDFQIDHLCGVKFCVLVPHLRLATPEQNVANKPGKPDYSLTNVEGVFFMGRWQLRENRYRAVLSDSGFAVLLGHYPTFEDAALALEQARAGWQPQLPGFESLTAAERAS